MMRQQEQPLTILTITVAILIMGAGTAIAQWCVAPETAVTNSAGVLFPPGPWRFPFVVVPGFLLRPKYLHPTCRVCRSIEFAKPLACCYNGAPCLG